MELNKKKIIELFINNVKGKKPEVQGRRHHGSHGHWLERQMGIKANSSNLADIFGYEMKTHTASKTSFGDWSPDKSLWGRYRSECSGQLILATVLESWYLTSDSFGAKPAL